MATSDFQMDLALWNISPIKGGFDAKELFRVYITRWIQEKRLSLLEFCKFDKDVLKLLVDRKDNRSWYKASRIAVSVLDDTLVSQMQQLLSNTLQEKDLEPPQRIMEVRSMLCKDAMNHKDNYLF